MLTNLIVVSTPHDQMVTSYTLNSHNVICKSYLNKAGKNLPDQKRMYVTLNVMLIFIVIPNPLHSLLSPHFLSDLILYQSTSSFSLLQPHQAPEHSRVTPASGPLHLLLLNAWMFFLQKPPWLPLCPFPGSAQRSLYQNLLL